MFKSILERQVVHRLFASYISRYSSNNSVPVSQTDPVENPEFIQKFLKKHPKVTKDSVVRFYQTFKDYSLPTEIVPNILKKCPELVRIPSEKFDDNLRSWLDINLGPEFIELISLNPSVLFLSKKHIESRYANLVEIFGRKSIGKMMMDSPLVLTEPVENIKLKIDFLEKELKYTKAEIIKTCALNCSYERIKIRFAFLRRAGVFKVPKPKTLVADKMDNPQLSKILFLNNHDFANQIAGVSLLEFNVFKQMMSNEEDSDYEDTHSAMIKTC